MLNVLAAAAVALVMLWVPEVAAATDLRVDVRRTTGVLLIDASAFLRADPATAWRVLTDYDRYADFVPGIRSSRVVSRRSKGLTVMQSGEASLWLLRMPVEIIFEIQEFPPTRIESRATAGIMQALARSYRLTPSAGGVLLEYEARLVARSALLGGLQQIAVRQSAIREVQALADEIERSYTATATCEKRC